MAIKLIEQVWKLDLPSDELLLLLAMAGYANHDGSRCYPAISRVAWQVGKDRRTVQRTIRKLQDRRILTPVTPTYGGRGKSTEWMIDLSRAPWKSPYIPHTNSGTGAAQPVSTRQEPSFSVPSARGTDQEREDDGLFAALVLAVGYRPSNAIEGRQFRDAINALRQSGASPALVAEAAASWKRLHPSAQLTPAGLARGYSRALNAPQPPKPPRPAHARPFPRLRPTEEPTDEPLPEYLRRRLN